MRDSERDRNYFFEAALEEEGKAMTKGTLDFTNLDQTTGEVTKEDIQMGIRRECEACPVARALERMFPGYFAHIDEHATISDNKGNTIVDMFISDDLLTWIDKFDNEKPIEPISLRIDRYDGGCCPWMLRIGDEPNEQR